jgi:RHH-type transcriptional regulator, proline utilization regulon repressor / proline dehydrogenase / delta 1-pyrroline-5-carboxylate dehydrogenase
MTRYDNLEDRVREIGLTIYEAIDEEMPSLFDGRGWKAEVLTKAMQDEAFKIQLFRFIDLLPALRTDIQVARLFDEYFSDFGDTPPIIRKSLEAINLGIRATAAAGEIRADVESLARQFIFGRTPQEALPRLERLRSQGIAASLDILGEEALSEKEAKQFADKYLDLLSFLAPKLDRLPEIPILDTDDKGPIPRLDVSLKVSSFYSQIDPVNWEGSLESAKVALGPIFRAAKELGAAVTIDMEHYYLKDLTLAIFKKVLEEQADFLFGGIVMQAYLKDSESDLRHLIEWAKTNRRRITVRLAKGAYWDYETVVNPQNGWPIPVFLSKSETDRNYERLTTILLENADYLRPAIATHNIRSLSHAIAVAETLEAPKNSFEFQMIYGMAEPIRRVLQERGFRVRAYAPIGELIPGMAYLIRRLLENTFAESFLRKSFVGKEAFQKLLETPQAAAGTQTEFAGEGFRNEPVTDFSKAENRDRMKRSLDQIKQEFGGRYPLFIAGEEIRKDSYIDSRNPARPSEIVGSVSVADSRDADTAISAARRSWATWRHTPPEQRAAFLFAAAEEMRKRRFELAALEIFEVGKTWKDADADVAEAIDYLEYYGQEMIRLGKPRQLGAYPGEKNHYLYEPRGIGVVISPWNFPIAIAAGMVSAGIVTGACVIFKPSGLSPICGWRLVEVFRNAGLPPGALQFVPGPGAEVGEYLVSHPDVDFIAFTGSKDVGLRIVSLAAETHPGQRNVKKVIAEMGGKNAIIVDETANLDDAVKGTLESALGFQGQKCSAASRVIVLEEVFDEFARRLKDAMESIEIGSPEDPRNLMGPVVDEAALTKIRNYVKLGKEEGAPALVREVDLRQGYFTGPAIIVDVKPQSRIAQEEIFGPVLTMFRAQSFDEALEIANSSSYALTGGIFSRSPANIRKAKEEFRVGNLYINRKITGALVGRQPFGGFAMSGVGSKAGGPDYLIQFCNLASISENTLRRGFAPR